MELVGVFGPLGPLVMIVASLAWGLWQRRGRALAATAQKQAEARAEGMRVAVQSLRPDAMSEIEQTETLRPPRLPTLRK